MKRYHTFAPQERGRKKAPLTLGNIVDLKEQEDIPFYVLLDQKLSNGISEDEKTFLRKIKGEFLSLKGVYIREGYDVGKEYKMNLKYKNMIEKYNLKDESPFLDIFDKFMRTLTFYDFEATIPDRKYFLDLIMKKDSQKWPEAPLLDCFGDSFYQNHQYFHISEEDYSGYRFSKLPTTFKNPYIDSGRDPIHNHGVSVTKNSTGTRVLFAVYSCCGQPYPDYPGCWINTEEYLEVGKPTPYTLFENMDPDFWKNMMNGKYDKERIEQMLQDLPKRGTSWLKKEYYDGLDRVIREKWENLVPLLSNLLLKYGDILDENIRNGEERVRNPAKLLDNATVYSALRIVLLKYFTYNQVFCLKESYPYSDDRFYAYLNSKFFKVKQALLFYTEESRGFVEINERQFRTVGKGFRTDDMRDIYQYFNTYINPKSESQRNFLVFLRRLYQLPEAVYSSQEFVKNNINPWKERYFKLNDIIKNRARDTILQPLQEYDRLFQTAQTSLENTRKSFNLSLMNILREEKLIESIEIFRKDLDKLRDDVKKLESRPDVGKELKTLENINRLDNINFYKQIRLEANKIRKHYPILNKIDKALDENPNDKYRSELTTIERKLANIRQLKVDDTASQLLLDIAADLENQELQNASRLLEKVKLLKKPAPPIPRPPRLLPRKGKAEEEDIEERVYPKWHLVFNDVGVADILRHTRNSFIQHEVFPKDFTIILDQAYFDLSSTQQKRAESLKKDIQYDPKNPGYMVGYLEDPAIFAWIWFYRFLYRIGNEGNREIRAAEINVRKGLAAMGKAEKEILSNSELVIDLEPYLKNKPLFKPKYEINPNEAVIGPMVFKWEQDSCWIDAVFIALFKIPDTWLQKSISNARYVYKQNLGCTPKKAYDIHKYLWKDILYVQNLKTKVMPEYRACLSRKIIEQCLLNPKELADYQKNFYNTSELLLNSLPRFYGVQQFVEIKNITLSDVDPKKQNQDEDEPIDLTEMDPIDKDTRILIVNTGNAQKYTPSVIPLTLENGKYSLVSVILFKGGHFGTAIRDPSIKDPERNDWWIFTTLPAGGNTIVRKFSEDEYDFGDNIPQVVKSNFTFVENGDEYWPVTYIYMRTTDLPKPTVDLKKAPLVPQIPQEYSDLKADLEKTELTKEIEDVLRKSTVDGQIDRKEMLRLRRLLAKNIFRE